MIIYTSCYNHVTIIDINILNHITFLNIAIIDCYHPKNVINIHGMLMRRII